MEYSFDDSSITLRTLEKIFQEKPKLSISSKINEKIDFCRKYLDQKLENSSEPFYGINTGFGSLCDVKISGSEILTLQENLVRSHACGMGDRIDDSLSSMILFLKIKNMCLGHSGVRPKLVDRMIDIYNKGLIPEIYELGSLGASGDLAPLAHLGLLIIQEHPDEGLDSFALKEKEGIAILNGTQFCLSFAAWSTIQAEKLFHLANRIAAISLEAFMCDSAPFHDAIHKIRPHSGQVLTAQSINKNRAQSSFADLPKISVQDPYSFRCIPQVHGATFDAIMHTKSVVEKELNSVTDNPLIFPEEDLILSGGNFHAQPLGLVLDYLSIGVSELGSISERRLYQLISGERNLPPFLVNEPGLNSGFMITQYTAASIVNQNKILCTPATADSIISCKGQEDHVSMAANAATKCKRIVDNVKRILALELFAACQALEYRRPSKSSPIVEKIYSKVRSKIDFLESDREMVVDIQKAEVIIEELLLEIEIE